MLPQLPRCPCSAAFHIALLILSDVSFPQNFGRFNDGRLSRSDICYPGATFRVLRERELRRGHLVPAFELTAKVRRLFVAEVEGDFFDGVTGAQQVLGGEKPAFVQPVLGRAVKMPAKMPLQLPC